MGVVDSSRKKADLERKVKDLKAANNKLDARRAEFVTAQKIAEEEKSVSMAASAAAAANMVATPAAQTTPTVRIKPTSLPNFHGCKRSFHRWKKDWESLQKHGEPTGSVEVKKMQLLDSVNEKIIRDLRLSTYNAA